MHAIFSAALALLLAGSAFAADAAAAAKDQPQPGKLAGPNPRFPERALDHRIEGSATFGVTTDNGGRVVRSELIGEDPQGWAFGTAGKQAIDQWTFAAPDRTFT